ncbi:MFS transporter [Sphingomonas daechungensis]|uniref:MFS transporter n=1 Tax=Sphingomonas daechungensis TaxID=1176646 RepID=UPI00294FF761|nr:MFS transporter [Sphingomonas daechungensis]
MTDEPTAADRPRVSGYAWYALILFVIVYIFNFIDRQILSILAESIKADLKLDDAQIGFLYGTAFAVFYALFGIPLGRLADSWYRGRLMAIGLALWSSMTALSGFAQNFGTLAVARVGVGIGEASASPAAFSMIADYFPKERRATALSIYSSGLYIGGGLALPLGGFVLASWGRAYPNAAAAPLGLEPWQAAFVAVGLPGILLAAWIWSLKEPLRGAIDGHPSEIVRPNAWREFGRELAAIIPPLTLLSVARIPGAIVPNLFILAGCIAGAFLLGSVTGDWPQWFAWWTGIYAVSSWTQSLKHRDPGTHRLIWGTPQFVTLAIGFGSISFMTYAVAFWIPPYVLRTFYTGPTDAALLLQGRTAAEEVSTLFGWSAAFASATGVILGASSATNCGVATPPVASTLRWRLSSFPLRRSISSSRPTTSPTSTWSRLTSGYAARCGLAPPSPRFRTSYCRACAAPPAQLTFSEPRSSDWHSAPIFPGKLPR